MLLKHPIIPEITVQRHRWSSVRSCERSTVKGSLLKQSRRADELEMSCSIQVICKGAYWLPCEIWWWWERVVDKTVTSFRHCLKKTSTCNDHDHTFDASLLRCVNAGPRVHNPTATSHSSISLSQCYYYSWLAHEKFMIYLVSLLKRHLSFTIVERKNFVIMPFIL